MYGNWIRSKFSASLILKTIEETFSNYEGVAQMQNFGPNKFIWQSTFFITFVNVF